MSCSNPTSFFVILRILRFNHIVSVIFPADEFVKIIVMAMNTIMTQGLRIVTISFFSLKQSKDNLSSFSCHSHSALYNVYPIALDRTER